MAAVIDVFGDAGDKFVFLGGCVPAFYARPTGAPIRPTKDVDAMSTISPWILQEELLADLCAFGKLAPVPEMQFRYRVPGTELLIDVMSPDGINVGGGASWMREAADAAIDRTLPDGRTVRVVTPPYFVVLKLTAFLDRGEDLISSKDMEDIVCIAIEVDDLVIQVNSAGLTSAIQSLWRSALEKHNADVAYIRDIVDAHLHREDDDRSDRAIAILRSLARGQ